MTRTGEEWKNYTEKTFAELDAEVERAVCSDRNRKVGKFLICLVIFMFLFPNAFLYWLRFTTPHFAKCTTDEIIDITKAPVQTDIKELNKIQ